MNLACLLAFFAVLVGYFKRCYHDKELLKDRLAQYFKQ